MHASIEQLLNLHDAGKEAAELVSHVADCKSCQAELGRLHVVRIGLQRLPDFQAPEGSWELIAQASKSSVHSAGRPDARTGRGGNPARVRARPEAETRAPRHEREA